MRLLLCLAATLSVCQGRAIRTTRGIVGPDFPNFHAVHHGYGATSYQNVQIENYGSVPIPTEDHQPHHKHHVELHVHEEPVHYPHHHHHHPPADVVVDHDIHEAVAVIPQLEDDHHHHQYQDYIIVENEVPQGPVVDEIPVVEEPEEEHQHVIALEHVPYSEDELQHIQLQHAPQYYGNGYEHDYEYH